MPRRGRDDAASPGTPRELRQIVEREPTGSVYVFVSVGAGTLALLLRHPRPFAVVASMRASGRISDDLARLLEDKLRQSGR